MPFFVKGTNIELIGTLENMYGWAAVADQPLQDGDPVYTGETNVYSHTQETVMENSERLWVATSGDSYRESEIEWRTGSETV